MQMANLRADSIFALFIGGLLGFCFFALLFTIVEGARGTSPDQLRFWGAFLSGAVAAALFGATWWRDRITRARQLERIKHAIWIDLVATLPAVYVEWRAWNGACLDKEKRGRFFQIPRDSEHLTPTALQANLNVIGELTDDQALTGVLVHDNLRTLREQIDRVAAMLGKPSDDDVRLALTQEAERLARLVCVQLQDAIRAFDPDERRRDALSESTRKTLFARRSATWTALREHVEKWKRDTSEYS